MTYTKYRIDALAAMQAFVATVEAGGFAAAAPSLDITPAMVGRRVRQLEQELGAALIVRTTRQHRLTDIGKAYHKQCLDILERLEEASRAVQYLKGAPSGKLRISAPLTLAGRLLSRLLAVFMRRYPAVDVDLHATDQVVDLVSGGLDASIRVGALPDSSLVARPLAPYEFVTCAAPAYLQAHGRPSHPHDLEHHNCLGFVAADTIRPWVYVRDGAEVEVAPTGSMRASHGEALRNAALEGLGVIVQPRLLLADDLEAGRLETVLGDWKLPAEPLHIVYPQHRILTPTLRAFIEFMVEAFDDPAVRRSRQ